MTKTRAPAAPATPRSTPQAICSQYARSPTPFSSAIANPPFGATGVRGIASGRAVPDSDSRHVRDSLIEREDLPPVALHADHQPALLLGQRERLPGIRVLVVGVLAR